MNIVVIFEDNHLLAVNKRAGDLSQKDRTDDDSLIEKIKAYIKKKYEKPGEVFLGSIHRLDRPTSGVIIYARTSKALSRMHEVFRKKALTKKYLALVSHRPPQLAGDLEHHLMKDKKKNKSFVTNPKNKDGKLASLSYRLLREVEKHHLLEVILHTGRHHQIRSQLSHIGCRIVGDMKYGYPDPNKDKSICLHCSEVSFVHPVNKEVVRITAHVPRIPEWSGIRLGDLD